MAPYEALYGQRRRSPIGWFEPTEVGLLGPNLVHDALEKVALIQQWLKTAQSRQKSYTDDWGSSLQAGVTYIDDFGSSCFLCIDATGVCAQSCSHRFTEVVEINDGLTYDEEHVEILDRKVRRLRTKDIDSVKVLWRNHDVEEATREAEEDMKI
ncbi:uncharacterized protein LOC142180136 [Nicotiana tabacum]|uniref:Uncharacterized protein LOC142180136 n=1 Tax=Nicotiana tabacum TaxID=4097 RepID=A0AC58UD63_TOBAC